MCPSVPWIFLRPRCCSEWRFTLRVGYTAKFFLLCVSPLPPGHWANYTAI